MYYYILEQPKSIYVRNVQKKVRKILASLGIEGEMGVVSPARTVEEHTEIAMIKKYSTIVAVGSDILINKIASYLQGTNYVLGIIPVNASEFITNLIGSSELEESCESLKFRRLKIISLAIIEPKKNFLGKVDFVSSKPVETMIKIDNYETCLSTTNMSIVSPNSANDNFISLYIRNNFDGPGNLTKGLYWLFGKKIQNIYFSILRGKSISINTSEPLPLVINSQIIAKTPISVKLKPNVLKIITRRANIVKDSISKPTKK